MGGRVIARAKHPEICDATGWPALPSRQSAWSTPELSRTQPWIAAKGRTSNKPPQQPSVQLENRFALLLQDPKLIKYQTALLHTHLWKNARCLRHCVSVLLLRREDVLNRSFTHLMSTLCFVTLSLFIHGPIPPIRGGFREREIQLIAGSGHPPLSAIWTFSSTTDILLRKMDFVMTSQAWNYSPQACFKSCITHPFLSRQRKGIHSYIWYIWYPLPVNHSRSSPPLQNL